MASDRADRARMLVSCPDQPGIIAAVSRFVFEQGGNILDLDQHATRDVPGQFFLRLEFELQGLVERLAQVREAFAVVASRFQMTWRITEAAWKRKVAIFCSKEDHCLLELLWQARAGELRCELTMVVSNHPDLRPLAESYGVPFHHVPATKDNRAEATAKHLGLLSGNADLVVLARYMQILPTEFCEPFRHRIINIHHSFLPAFVGANPYAQAHQRGVKLIGATAHYVTRDLDQGPIIEQDVMRVGHRHEVEDLRRIGKDVERGVLARAVRWHLEDRVLVHGTKTVVFQ